ncbi:MAG: hypothetical protein WAM24_12925, partial [Ignavibacteriaceae bacterium]
SGNLQTDSRYLFSQNKDAEQIQAFSAKQFQSSETGKKSPLLGGLFSLILPGAGEFYSESYLKAGIFFVVEAAVVTTAIIYNNKGNNKTDEFQNYADQNWSVARYADWMIQNKDILGLTEVDANKMRSDIFKSTDQNLPPWQQVNFGELNYYESQVGSNGFGFTHQLPLHGEQQYFELIGKYHQYSPGWAKYTGGSDVRIIPAQMVSYSVMRGDANNYYNTAETAVIGIYLNHFLSTLDGVWSAIRFNKDIAFNARVNTLNVADKSLLVPTFNIKYNF